MGHLSYLLEKYLLVCGDFGCISVLVVFLLLLWHVSLWLLLVSFTASSTVQIPVSHVELKLVKTITREDQLFLLLIACCFKLYASGLSTAEP